MARIARVAQGTTSRCSPFSVSRIELFADLAAADRIALNDETTSTVFPVHRSALHALVLRALLGRCAAHLVSRRNGRLLQHQRRSLPWPRLADCQCVKHNDAKTKLAAALIGCERNRSSFENTGGASEAPATTRVKASGRPFDAASTRRLAAAAREIVLVQAKRANVGHIGSALSVVEILATLYSGIMRVQGPDHDERDRFVLSKGHAALALYAMLFLNRRLSEQQLQSYCGDGTWLGVHPDRMLPGIDFTTGSLGHGLSIAAGAALAGRLRRSARRAYVLLRDAELNEGSVWEAAMFAAHPAGNLIAIVDLNGRQALGFGRRAESAAARTAEPLAGTFRNSGHDIRLLLRASTSSRAPRLVLARCVSAAVSRSWNTASNGAICRCRTNSNRRPSRR